jgi:hypothetical protein
MLDKVMGTLDEKIKAGIEVGAGTLLVMGKLGKGKPGTVVTVVGGVLAGAGLKRGLRSFGVITGYGMVDVISGYNPNPNLLNGFQKVPVIGGYQTAPIAINGLKPGHSKVMGSVGSNTGSGSGSGRLSNGSECMG